MSWNGSSHISGRYKYHFTGSEYISVSENNTLDIVGSFSLSFLIKPDPVSRLNYALFSKGHPTNPSLGSISGESINGFMRVYLHNANGTNSLVYDTNTSILNTDQIIHIEVVWDFNNKILNVYKNAVAMGITINTSNGNFHTAPNLMGNINTDNNNLEFGRSVGKQPFIGTLFDVLYIGRARTSTEISNYYDTIKYLGSYPPLGTIVFSRFMPVLGRYQLHTMLEDGTDQNPLFSTNINCFYPKWSPDGSHIVFNNSDFDLYSNYGANNTFYTVNSSGGTFTTMSVQGPYGAYACWTADNNLLYPVWNGGVNTKRVNSTTGLLISSYDTPEPPFGQNGVSHWVDINPSYSFFVYRDPASGNLFRVNIDNSYNYVSHAVLDFVSETTNYAHNLRNPRINYNATLIGYSKRQSHINSYNIFTVNSDGSNPQQLTFSSAYNYIFSCFSPDGTKILFTENSSGVFQLKTMNLNGTNIVNISNNNFNDFMAHWKA